jgi:hypothetical protein
MIRLLLWRKRMEERGREGLSGDLEASLEGIKLGV